MKRLILVLAIIFSINSYSQTEHKKDANEKIVKKALYTEKEKEVIRKNFRSDVAKIKMTPETKTKYLEIIDKNLARIQATNKDRNLTQAQASFNINKIIEQQNNDVKAILSPEQYKKHKMMMDRFQNSMNYRIEKQ